MLSILRIRLAKYLLFSLVILPLAVTANCQPGSSDIATADAAYDSGDWKTAAILFNRVTSADPKNARAWYRLGVALRQSGERDKSITALQRALQAGALGSATEYQIALAYASLHKPDPAFEHLKNAAVNGFAQPELLQSDGEWSPYHSDPRFFKLLESLYKNQKPCSYSPENRQFDFWIGDWKVVTTGDNVPAGTSRIAKILSDCVILENWTSANAPYQGKSYNTYNTALKRWEQFWVDNSQGMIHFYGSLKDGAMDYWTDPIPQPDGKILKRHLQFIPHGPDQVRQFSQGSNDDGQTWFVEYDLTYNRSK